MCGGSAGPPVPMGAECIELARHSLGTTNSGIRKFPEDGVAMSNVSLTTAHAKMYLVQA